MKPVFTSLLLMCIVACSSESSIQPNRNSETSNAEDVLSFSSKEDFEKSFYSENPKSPSKTFSDGVYEGRFFEVSDLRSSETRKVSIEELVPDKTLSKMLNSEGEIIIADTLYKITQNGTFFAHVLDKADLLKYVDSYSSLKRLEEPIRENLYKYGNSYRFDSYRNFDFTIEDTNGRGELRSDNFEGRPFFQDIDVTNFTKKNPKPENYFSGLWGKLGGRISNILYINTDRRLNCEVFSVDNVFLKTEGITAKYQKKMWYGSWAKFKYIKPNRLRIGFRDVMIVNELKIDNPHFPRVLKIETDDDGIAYKKFIDIVYGRKEYNKMVYSSDPNANIIHGNMNNEGGIGAISYYPWTVLLGPGKVYEFHPSFWARNEDDESEITFRFSQSLKTIFIGVKNLSPYNFTPNEPINPGTIQGLNNLRDTFVVNFESPDYRREMVRGYFYAALEYDGVWRGMYMPWD